MEHTVRHRHYHIWIPWQYIDETITVIFSACTHMHGTPGINWPQTGPNFTAHGQDCAIARLSLPREVYQIKETTPSPPQLITVRLGINELLL